MHLVYSPMSSEWGAYDVANDGKRFLVDSPDQAPAEERINMIVNWGGGAEEVSLGLSATPSLFS